VTHGASGGDDKKTRTTEYVVWVGMRQRCNNPRHAKFANYGGRGITVCERWDSFVNFLADMGERPGGRTLDRIDSNGNYEPGNCRWATLSEQNKNRRPQRLAFCTGRGGSPRCGWFAGHRGYCKTAPEELAEGMSAVRIPR
jgi:hypothetical protein